jgi:HAD superfamily phosphatase (TIGR01668 family)
VSLDLLAHWGIRGVALDLDNTIVPWYTSALEPGIPQWVQRLRDAGIRMCLITNNYGAQSKDVAIELGLPLVRGALKPLPIAFARCLREIETEPAKALAIGDQLFTDVLGAKLTGMKAVYVRPLAARAFLTTKFLRMIERPVFAQLRRAGVPGA